VEDVQSGKICVRARGGALGELVANYGEQASLFEMEADPLDHYKGHIIKKIL
jgi:hypothetical protein